MLLTLNHLADSCFFPNILAEVLQNVHLVWRLVEDTPWCHRYRTRHVLGGSCRQRNLEILEVGLLRCKKNDLVMSSRTLEAD